MMIQYLRNVWSLFVGMMCIFICLGLLFGFVFVSTFFIAITGHILFRTPLNMLPETWKGIVSFGLMIVEWAFLIPLVRIVAATRMGKTTQNAVINWFHRQVAVTVGK